MKLILFFITFIFSPFNFYLIAQNPIAFQISDDKGLPSNTIYSIIQDKKGYIWLGTDIGLYRFDGRNFVSYKSNNQQSNSLTGLVLDSKNRLYCYNFNGQIFYLENDKLNYLSCWEKGRISSMDIDQNNNLWINYEKGISVYNASIKKLYQIDNPKSKNVDFFTNSGSWNKIDNNYWCISPEGLMRASLKNTKVYTIKWNKNKVSGEFLLASNTKDKWIFSQLDGDIFRLLKGKVIPFYSKNLNSLLVKRKITKVEGRKGNKIWIYTYTGIIIYDVKNDVSEIIFENKAFSGGIKDNENTVWLGSLYDGIFKIPCFEFKIWEIADDKGKLSKPNKIAIGKESVFFSTSDGKVGVIKDSKSNLIYHKLNSDIDIQCLSLSNSRKKVYLNSQNEIHSYNGKTFLKLPIEISSPKHIIETESDLLICSSRGAYGYNLNNKKIDSITNLWSREIFFKMNTKELFIATNEGLKIYCKINNKWIQKKSFLTHLQIISINYSLFNKSLFILCYNGCIYELDSNLKLKKIISLSNEIIANQLKVDTRKVFISSNKGLFIYNLKSKKIDHINRLDGLISDHINSIDIDNNMIWMSSNKGILCLPKKYEHKKIKSKLFLKNVTNSKNEKLSDKNLLLNYNQSFYVNLNVVTLSSEHNYKIAYRINNNSWIYSTAEDDKIYFNSIEPGSFKLEIKVINHKGYYSKNKIVIKGYVAPPFWQKWWFYVSIVIFSIIITYLYFKNRINKIKKKQAQTLEKLQLQHDLKLSQETAIRAQMNPHFIFNVLNSIKTYIYENDKKMAINYLNDFSELVRKILVQSSNTYTKLKDEIELLKLYIELEGMLFQNDFSYQIRIDDEIDSHNIYIPNLIIQPYIENAFKHGLRHKKGSKNLIISVFFEENESSILVIEIEDNGIGRKKSEKLNRLNDSKHDSFSTQAIDRITKLNQNQPGIIDVNYKDLFENEVSTGTIVRLKIRLDEEN